MGRERPSDTTHSAGAGRERGVAPEVTVLSPQGCVWLQALRFCFLFSVERKEWLSSMDFSSSESYDHDIHRNQNIVSEWDCLIILFLSKSSFTSEGQVSSIKSRFLYQMSSWQFQLALSKTTWIRHGPRRTKSVLSVGSISSLSIAVNCDTVHGLVQWKRKKSPRIWRLPSPQTGLEGEPGAWAMSTARWCQEEAHKRLWCRIRAVGQSVRHPILNLRVDFQFVRTRHPVVFPYAREEHMLLWRGGDFSQSLSLFIQCHLIVWTAHVSSTSRVQN